MKLKASIRSLTCMLAVIAMAPHVRADNILHELKIGVLAHDVPDLWSGFRVEDDSVAINVEAIFSPSIPFLGGAIRPAIGASLATEGGTSSGYIDARWEIETPSGIFFAVGFGAALHDGELELKSVDQNEKALGSRVLFHIPAELGFRFDGNKSVSVYFEHMSNADTGDNNEGLDRLGVRYGYRF
jgi:lipid A 3-O-deacylase